MGNVPFSIAANALLRRRVPIKQAQKNFIFPSGTDVVPTSHDCQQTPSRNCFSSVRTSEGGWPLITFHYPLYFKSHMSAIWHFLHRNSAWSLTSKTKAETKSLHRKKLMSPFEKKWIARHPIPKITAMHVQKKTKNNWTKQDDSIPQRERSIWWYKKFTLEGGF